MLTHDATIWHNGTLRQFSDVSVSLATHTLHYGGGVFEGIRAYETPEGTAIFRLTEHIERLFYSASVLGMEIPFSQDDLHKACAAVVRENNLAEAYIRPIVFFNDASLGIVTTKNAVEVVIMAWAWGQYLTAEEVRVCISPYRRISERSTVSDAKICGHYANSLLATNDARSRGFTEALLLDHDGHIAEGPGENIFFVTGTELHTPRAGKILTGITRNAIMTLAQDHGYTVVEKDIVPEDLADYEAAFFTGTAVEVTPIDSITIADGQDVHFNRTNTIVVAMQQAFDETVHGRNPAHAAWCTVVAS